VLVLPQKPQGHPDPSIAARTLAGPISVLPSPHLEHPKAPPTPLSTHLAPLSPTASSLSDCFR
jgi:hypothetical protein